MNPTSFAPRASMGVCLLGLSMAVAARVEAPASGATAAAPAAAAPAAAPKAKKASSSPTAAAHAAAAERRAAAMARVPRPQMGLHLAMTQPKGHANDLRPLKPSRYQNTQGTEKANEYYAGVWGVDQLKASSTNSGNLIKFSYRVLDPKRAAALGAHDSTPELVGIRSNAVLHVPTMEKIGQLRQMSAAEADKNYWMVFSNKGKLVKPGDEVSVIIGHFRADGIIVE